MARLRTHGYEIAAISAAGQDALDLEGAILTNSPLIETTVVRTGARSLKSDSGAGNAASDVRMRLKSTEVALGRSYFYQLYFQVPAYPSTDAAFMVVNDNSGAGGSRVKVRLTTTGTVQLFVGGSQQGSDSASVPLNKWVRVAVQVLYATGAGDAFALRVDGVPVASVSGLSVGDLPIQDFQAGWGEDVPGANKVIYIDDISINDDQGSNENSWPSDEKIVFLRPISDNAVGTGWVDGDGTGTLFGSVDNAPPAGAATPADGTQIKHLTNGQTTDYDANVTTYSSAGLIPGDKILLVQAVCSHGEDINTGTKNGALQIVSNPAQSGEDAFVYGDDVGADGAWPAGWHSRWGTPQYLPSVTFGTSPVLRVGKRTSTVREVHVDMMGIYVAYQPAKIPMQVSSLPRFEPAWLE